jgi:phosphoglycerol transferase MdoB-like AlkP superfamily enzyme
MQKFNFESFFNILIKIIFLNIAFLILMSLYRLIFLLYFADAAALRSFISYIPKAFIMGLRFDASFLSYVSMPVVVTFLIMLCFSANTARAALKAVKLYYWFIFSLFTLAVFIDFGFYIYFQDRINILIFGLVDDDTSALIGTIITDRRFALSLIIFLFISFFVYKICAKLNLKNKFRFNFGAAFNASAVVAVLCVMFIIGRGTFGMFPLGTFHSQISPDIFINKVSLSVVQPIADTIAARAQQKSGKINLAQKFGAQHLTPDIAMFEKRTSAKGVGFKPPNVVVIVMESFGLLPMLYNSENFNVLGDLKKHFDEDTLLHILPSGSITVEALEELILNMPQTPSGHITQTGRAYKLFESSAANVFKSSGYVTKAVYGGSFAWRDMNGFLKAQGFDKLIGEGDITPEYKHQWGINDEQFLDLVYKELESSGGKTFIFAMSTAVHPPYEYPPYYKPLSVNIPQEITNMMPHEKKYGKKIFETSQFAVMRLSAFMDKIKSSELSQKTVVVITGDHSLREFSNFSDEDMFLRYAVPLYIYAPEAYKKHIDKYATGMHLDIMPTMYNLALSDKSYVAAGFDLSDTKARIAFNSKGLIIKKDIAVKYEISNNTFKSFMFDKVSAKLFAAPETVAHKELVEQYKLILLSADKYLSAKHPVGAKNEK